MIIKNACILDYRGRKKGDLLIEDGYIRGLGSFGETGHEIIDAKGQVLMPSFVDLHVHMRDPGLTYKEDLETGARAALKGGYTIINAMANTRPVVDNRGIYEDIITRSNDLGLIDLHQVMTVSKKMEGKDLIDFDDLPESLTFLSDDGKGILSNHLMYQALKKAKEKNIGIMVHAEDPDISPYDYRAAEDLITIRDIYLSKATGAKVHFSHVSTYDSLEAIRLGKIEGLNISCETTPHHIALSDLDYRVNPPIRTERDRLKLIESIQNGTVDAIATDHAPHSKEDKDKGAPGSIGLESSFPVVYTELVERGYINLERLSKLMSYNPGHILGLDHGIIEPGLKADIVLVNINETTMFTENYFASKSKNSMFIEKEFKGRVKMTIKEGKVLYEDNR